MRLFVLLALILGTCLPLHAQDNPGGESDGTPFPSLVGLPSVKVGKIALNPYAQAGYQRVGCNISFPIQIEEVVPINNRLQVGTMELWLQDASFWTGTVGLNAVLNPSLTIFASAGGFAPKNLGAPSVLPVRINDISLPSEMDFTGDKVEYWVMQAGASFALEGGWSVLVGYLWDHFAMEAVDPRIGSTPFPDQTLRADFLTKTSVPFVGLQLNNLEFKYRASIIYSPLAAIRCLMATRNSLGTLTELRYSFNKPGQLVAVNGEYDVQLVKSLSFNVWVAGLWMRARGTGNLEYQSTLPRINLERSESDASVAKYSVGGGLGFGLIF